VHWQPVDKDTASNTCSDIGAQIRALRERLGWSQTQLAGHELTRGFISQVESGRVWPSLHSLRIIAARLRVSPARLLPGFSPQWPLYPELDEAIGVRLKRARLKAGLTQRQLAEPDSTRSYVSQVEIGITEPSLAALAVYARKLNTPMAWFVTGLPPVAVGPPLPKKPRRAPVSHRLLLLTGPERTLIHYYRRLSAEERQQLTALLVQKSKSVAAPAAEQEPLG
jgi:transcriptional regulator with XRE-family HTH domain